MLHFTTAYGEHYTVNDKGQIGGGPNKVRHGPGWTFYGIARTGPGFAFGQLVARFAQLTPELIQATQWRYTTSHTPRFTVVDVDHGTRRAWGNYKAHGIRFMWFED